jgi:hypothetical protein
MHIEDTLDREGAMMQAWIEAMNQLRAEGAKYLQEF